MPLSETERTGYGATVPLMRERNRNDGGPFLRGSRGS